MSQPQKSSASVKRSSTGSMSLKREATTGRFRGSQIPGASVPLISTFIDEGGHVVVELVADSFGMSKGQLAETVGLGRGAFYKATRARAPKTQSRIREMLEIVSRISTWAGGKEQAMAWYRAQPIPAFGDRTANRWSNRARRRLSGIISTISPSAALLEVSRHVLSRA